MNPPIPPPLVRVQPRRFDRRGLLFFGLAAGIFVVALIILRLAGLLHPFSVPTGSMAPAIARGDHVLMEGVSSLKNNPQRGDIVVFRTDGIAALPSGQIYTRRVAGLPGDHVQISDGRLFVNDKPVALSNARGEISYHLPQVTASSATQTNVI